MGLFVALGVWQLNRAHAKHAMLSRYEALSQRSPVELRLPLKNEARWRYRRVELTGCFHRERQFLLDNQVRDGQVGYDVLASFEPSGNAQRVLVDRGWVPLGASRDRLPRVPVTARQVTIRGTVYVPYEKGYSLGGMDTGERGWPRRVQFVDFEQMGLRLHAPLARMTVRLDSASPYGYVREWQVAPFSPQRHLGYAVQWFALAVGMLVIFAVVNLKRLT